MAADSGMSEQHLVYAKKFQASSRAANVLQTLNMAMAFGLAGAELRLYPGVARSSSDPDPLLDAVRQMGYQQVPAGWRALPGGQKGLYSLLFRQAILRDMLRRPRPVFLARDVAEGALIAALGQMLRPRFVYEAHEVLHLIHKNQAEPRWGNTRRREQAILRAARGVVATNRAVEDDLRQSLDYAGPVLIAPNGYNPAIFHPLPLFDAQNPWPEKNDRVRLVYIGQFHDGKGLPTLIEALAVLPERYVLRVIGGAPVEAYQNLRSQVEGRPELNGRVEFLGTLPQAAIRQACLGCHLAVIPQQDASLFFSPIKMNECLALGLPVLCTPLPIFDQQRSQGVVFCSDGPGPDALARAADNLAANPDLARSLHEKGPLAAKEHTWLARAERILKFIAVIC